MSSRLFDPFDEADRLGIPVEFDDWCLAPSEMGAWLPQFGTIYMRSGLSACLERTVIAHELGHAHYDHRESNQRTELLADLYASEHLIDPEHLVDAMRCSPDPRAWALDLRVTPRLVRLYARVHEPELQRMISRSHLARMAS